MNIRVKLSSTTASKHNNIMLRDLVTYDDDCMMKLTKFVFINRPLRVQSSPGPRASTAEETTPSQPRPVTAAALPSQTPAAAASAAVSAGAIQLSDLQTILSGMNGEKYRLQVTVMFLEGFSTYARKQLWASR